MTRSSLIFFMIMAFSFTKALAGVSFDLYGRLKVAGITSSKKVASFANNNQAAITHVGNLDTTTTVQHNFDESRRTSFQTQQSRAGLKIKTSKKIDGILEVDFVDFTQSTHGAGKQIRLRLAYFTYDMNPNIELSAGQKWLTYTGGAPHTHNLIQNSFYSGNSGFIGQEFVFKYHTGDFDLYTAIGSRGKNTGAENTQVELGSMPAISVRADYNFLYGLVGIAFIGAEMGNEDLSTDLSNNFRNSNSYATKLFTKLSYRSFSFVMEGYYGQNTEDLALLTLAGSNFNPQNNSSIHTMGGFLSGKYDVSSKISAYGGVGMAKHDEAGSKMPINSLSQNCLKRIGLDWKPETNLTVYSEMSFYDTEYVLAAGVPSQFDATVLEVGLDLTF